jgi:outer membrane protein, heavy metal efflux system
MIRIRIISALTIISVVWRVDLFANDTIPYSKARDIILTQNRSVLIIDKEAEAVKVNLDQKRIYPDPVASVNVNPVNLSEISVGIEQTIERSAKKKARITVAQKEFDQKIFEKKISNAELSAEIVKRFIPVAFAAQKLLLIDSIIAESRVLEEQIRKKVEAGATMRIDLTKAGVETEKLLVERNGQVRTLNRLQKYFASLAGSDSGKVSNVSGEINTSIKLPSIDELRTAIGNNPNSENIQKSIVLMDAQQELLKAEALLDPTFSVEYVRNNEENQNALFVGMSLELPIFKKNKNEIQQVTLLKESILRKQKLTEDLILTDVYDLYEQISICDEKIHSLQNDIMPKMSEMYSDVKQIYESGKTSYRDLSDIRSEIFSQRTELIDLELEKAQLIADVIEKTAITIELVK